MVARFGVGVRVHGDDLAAALSEQARERARDRGLPASTFAGNRYSHERSSRILAWPTCLHRKSRFRRAAAARPEPPHPRLATARSRISCVSSAGATHWP